VNDHTAGDGDDEQDDGESQKHLNPFPCFVFPAGNGYPMPARTNHLDDGGWFTAY
jgi:hypothetical protein